eukprot:jgi/Ulvmu1/7822/UM004_0051.1
MPCRKKVLCVAEKPMVAREVTKCLVGQLPQNNARGRVPNFNFTFTLNNGDIWDITFTAVRGHVMEHVFPDACKSWQKFPMKQLFETQVTKQVASGNEDVADNLRHQTRGKDLLALWLDCDREGEAIGFEVMELCHGVKRSLAVKRARFSALVPTEIKQAINNTVAPNKREADAVEARSILDLRSGAAFTRYQTLLLQRAFDFKAQGFRQLDSHGYERENLVISYGSCQYPTLGLIVKRHWERKAHVPEPFWKIIMKHSAAGKVTEFNWARNRLFDHQIALILFEMCVDDGTATVTKVDGQQKTRRAPLPLSTLEMQKKCTQYLRVGGDQVMAAAEALYQKGLISYPRTETDQFDQAQDVMRHCLDLAEGDINAGQAGWGWAQHASQIVHPPNTMWRWPANGPNNDNAHPPIHPTQYATPGQLTGHEKMLYEFICRSFLACCSQDAIGFETKIEVRIAQEDFTATGLMVIERNWLNVYRYTSWGGSEVPHLEPGSTFVPSELLLRQGQTEPPPKLTERDLLALMDRFGIGTDATVSDHIAKQQERGYAIKDNNQQFEPTTMGEALIGAYDGMGLKAVYDAETRGHFEEQLKSIVRGTKSLDAVLNEDGHRYKNAFESATAQSQLLMQAMALFFPPQGGGGAGGQQVEHIGACSCGGMLQLVTDPELQPVRPEICCTSAAINCTANLPDMPITRAFREFQVTQELCQSCQQQGRHMRQVHMRLSVAALNTEAPGVLDAPQLQACVLCDQRVRQLFQRLAIRAPRVRS